MSGALQQAMLMIGGAHICAYDPASAINTTLSNGNLTATLASGALGSARVPENKTTGKYYFEFTIGVASNSAVYGLLLSTVNYVSGTVNDLVAAYGSGNIDTNNGFSGNSVGSLSAGSVLGIAIDLTARLVWMRRGTGNWNGTVGANPATGVSGLTVQTGAFAPFAGFSSTAPAGTSSTLNLGDTAFAQAVPAGFDTWCGVVPPPVTDPYWSNVKLLLGFNDVNGSTGAPGMTDESPAAHGTPPVGSGGVMGAAQISTARSVFGGSSLLLDGTSAFVGWGDHTDWNLSNQQFTLECRIYATSVAAPHHFIIGQWGTAGNLGWQLWHNGTALQFMCSDDGTTNRTLATTTIAANTWYAVAVDFNGTKYRLYLDGVMVNSSTTLYTFNNSPADLRIGANTGASPLYFAGNVDELRLTVGTARYASDSGYTVPSTAFPRS